MVVQVRLRPCDAFAASRVAAAKVMAKLAAGCAEGTCKAQVRLVASVRARAHRIEPSAEATLDDAQVVCMLRDGQRRRAQCAAQNRR